MRLWCERVTVAPGDSQRSWRQIRTRHSRRGAPEPFRLTVPLLLPLTLLGDGGTVTVNADDDDDDDDDDAALVATADSTDDDTDADDNADDDDDDDDVR
jgi:hypothetical protein